MVIPAVRIVIQDDDGGVAPLGRAHDRIDRVDDEGLLIERIRIAGVPVLIGGRLDDADRRQVTGLQRGEKQRQVVLMIRLVGLADVGGRARRQMLWILCTRPVLEEGVVRNVVHHRDAADIVVRLLAGGVRETAHEGTPGNPRGIQQVADVPARHQDLRPFRVRTDVVRRVGIADHGTARRGIGNEALTREAILDSARKGRAGDEVEQSRGRRAEGRAERVVAQREMLRVVP